MHLRLVVCHYQAGRAIAEWKEHSKRSKAINNGRISRAVEAEDSGHSLYSQLEAKVWIQTTNSFVVLEPDLPAPSSLGVSAAAVPIPTISKSTTDNLLSLFWIEQDFSICQRLAPGAMGSSSPAPHPSIKGSPGCTPARILASSIVEVDRLSHTHTHTYIMTIATILNEQFTFI